VPETNQNPYAIRWSKFATGERLPFLVSARTGLPVQAPTYWATASRRSRGCQPNTLYNDLRALMFLYLWADARGVDLHDRFMSGALLTLAEITDIDTFCGRYIDEAIAELPGRAESVKTAASPDRSQCDPPSSVAIAFCSVRWQCPPCCTKGL